MLTEFAGIRWTLCRDTAGDRFEQLGSHPNTVPEAARTGQDRTLTQAPALAASGHCRARHFDDWRLNRGTAERLTRLLKAEYGRAQPRPASAKHGPPGRRRVQSRRRLRNACSRIAQYQRRNSARPRTSRASTDVSALHRAQHCPSHAIREQGDASLQMLPSARKQAKSAPLRYRVRDYTARRTSVAADADLSHASTMR